MAPIQHPQIDTVIVGGGPASLILSYILHGYIPYYKGGHHDQLLDSKLRKLPNLLHITSDISSHFGSSIRYSSQALPINALLDTLVRPNADTEIDPPSCVEWKYEPERAVSHVVLTAESTAGGQWAQYGGATDQIGTLSYSEMLSLPGYTFPQHFLETYGAALPALTRPTRAQVASYYAAWPAAVGIEKSIRLSSPVAKISRECDGFFVEPQNTHCKHLVLGTGIFTYELPAPSALLPIQQAEGDTSLPLLVVGSGFSAADAIIAAPPNRKLIHLYKWDPMGRPSPLRGCHHQAYPEYAGIYRQMKAAASAYSHAVPATSPLAARKKNPFFSRRDWAEVYEGLPSASIEGVAESASADGGSAYTVRIRLADGQRIERLVGGLEWHVGRRGELSFLDKSLRREVLCGGYMHNNAYGNGHFKGHTNGAQTNGATDRSTAASGTTGSPLVSSSTLRAKMEDSTEVAPGVFAIGSLTGDSLVRHAFGACVAAASRALGVQHGHHAGSGHKREDSLWQ